MEPASRKSSNEIQSILSSTRQRSRRIKLSIVVASALLAAGAGFAAYRMFSKKSENGQLSFETAAVKRGDLNSSITATGTVQALNTVEVGAEISGQIKTIMVDYNDSVEKGQLLAELDPQQQQAAVSEAKAKVLAARADQAQAKAALIEAEQAEKRAVALTGRGLASAKEMEAATAGAARAKASLSSSEASAALAQATYEAAVTKLSKTEIRSPISGTVLARKVEVGQAINAGMQTPVLFVIAEDLKRMQLSSRVDEADIGTVKVGQGATFTVDAYPDRTFESKVTSVRNVPTTEQNVVSYEVLLSVDNAELLLKPGMTATVDIVTDAQRDALIVPNKALRFSPPSEDEHRGMRGPQIPLLRGKRSGPSEASSRKSRPLEKLGKIGAGNGVVWILKGKEPKPIKVKKLATDGAETAIECPDLKAGDAVIVDLAETRSE